MIRTLTRRSVLGTAATLAGVAGLGAPALAAPKVVLKLGHLANEKNVWNLAALKFADEVKRLSNGTMEVQVFPNAQLGGEMDVLNGIQLGTADMTITGESLQNWAPSAALLAVPYAVRTLKQLDEVASGPIGQAIETQIRERAHVRPLAYFARGPRDLTANRPIHAPSDLNGLRLRIPNVPLFAAFWKAEGARPVPMAFDEVFTSLQNGTIDAQENPLALIESASFYEVQKVLNRTQHVRSWIYVVIGERQFSGLSASQQGILREAAKRMQAFERPLFLADEDKLAGKLTSQGMSFVDVDQEAFAKKGHQAVMDSLKPQVRELYHKMTSMT